MLLLLLILVVISLFIYYKVIKPHRYWTSIGVKQRRVIPILGDAWKQMFKLTTFGEMVLEIYSTGPNDRYCGMYSFNKPVLVLKDPELIKTITVKDFDHFVNHFNVIPEEADPIWAKNLFVLTGKKWHNMRSTLSPSFTSSKMRQMFALMLSTGEQFCQHFLQKDSDEITVIQMKDAFTRFTNDVIASTAFGIRVDSFKNPNNEFYLHGIKVTSFQGFWTNLKMVIMIFFPKILQIFRIGFFSAEIGHFFKKLVNDTIETREKNNTYRPDMIQLMMEAKKSSALKPLIDLEENSKYTVAQEDGYAAVDESINHKGFESEKRVVTNDDIVSQAILFFFAGFDSVSAIMTFVTYELAVNPDVQSRLRDEVDGVLAECGGTANLPYHSLLKMKYMDMVISEVLRMWPTAPAVDRVCTKPYEIPPINSDEKPIKIETGSLIWIPILGIHRDPRFYNDPDHFDPERFSDENKSKIIPGSYIPFGSGPRNCIASRFALLEIKTIIFQILANFELVPVEKTEIPLKMSLSSFNVNIEGGLWLGLKKRHTNYSNT